MPGHPETPEEATKLLIVEGYSDQHFYAELLEHLGCYAGTYIEVFKGRSNVEKTLEAFLKPTLFEGKDCVAVIVDADKDGANTANRLAAKLGKLSGQAVVCGQWTEGTPRIGLLVVPSPEVEGELETLVWQAWSTSEANRGPVGCIEAYVTCMRGHFPNEPFSDKTRLGALLAVRNEEDPRLGPGAQRRHIFDFDAPALAPLVNFLRGFGAMQKTDHKERKEHKEGEGGAEKAVRPAWRSVILAFAFFLCDLCVLCGELPTVAAIRGGGA